ncbi:ATP-dependent helicase HrpB [Chromatiaceae bacterium AAb-1]|nr:ATP-dependent helicase HrpB [Chromatiaceae bacterium AAb-1]
MLPVAAVCDEVLTRLSRSATVILSAPPGAGKSTYLPLYLLQHASLRDKRIIMLEPRRLAVRSIAGYLAAQLGETVGQTVGYQIRQEQKSSAATRLLIVTEGVLTRKIQHDPELSAVDILIFDEFHERSLHADLALALVREVQQLRDDLKVLIMSATLDTAALGQQLDAPVVSCEGRSFPVDIRYIAPDNTPVWQLCARQALQAAQQHQSSVLVFLPGQSEITQAAAWLAEQAVSAAIRVYPLIGSMSLAEQQQAIAPAPAGQYKIVLATNLAQTSLTIEGINVVVDSGLYRRASFNPRQGLSILETVPVSQASAIQRSGRAGRLAPGVAYRIDTAEKWQRRPGFDQPEMVMAELTSLRLEVAAWGCAVQDLQWITPPPPSALAAAEQLLQQLGALNTQGQITGNGRELHRLGTEPRLANMLLHAQQLEKQGKTGAVWLACRLAALLEESRQLDEDIYRQLSRLPQQPAAWQQAKKLAQMLDISQCHQQPLELAPLLLLRAWPDRLAMRRGQGYLLASGAGASLIADHPLQQQDWLVVLHLQQWQQENRITRAVAITVADILADWQHELQWTELTGWDEKRAAFLSEQQLCFGRCILQRRSSQAVLSAEQKQQAWLGYIRRNGLNCLPWQDNCRQLQARITLMAQYFPDESWPGSSDDVLSAELGQWLGPYLGNISKSQQLQQLPLYDALLARLSYVQQQQLQQRVPTHWQAPTGSRLPIDYLAENGPLLSVRIQEMYGQMDSPLIIQGRLALTVALLSPSRQPLQLTRDLASFWHNTWLDVKKEMKGRYPKHYWPDDPATAMPTTKTKKAMQR